MVSRLQPLVLLMALSAVSSLLCGVQEEPLTTNFRKCFLKVIPANTNASFISTLLLDGNQITLNQMDQQALESYPSLVELHLEKNFLTQVPARFFSVLPNLTTLSLAGNSIRSLDSDAFSGLDLLNHLDLSDNQLTSLPAQLTRGLGRLQVLNLRGNPWNCSCSLLSPFEEIQTANVTMGGAGVMCASPPNQAGSEVLKAAAQCSSSPSNITEPLTPATSGLSTVQNTIQNHNTTSEQRAALGNSWKFTACVAALALVTSGLIICAVKGPSWYKLFHNYRHRRLHQDGNDNDGSGRKFATTIFKKKGNYQTPPTLGLENQESQVEEEEQEDDYFEDPYIKNEGNQGDETPTEA